MQVHLPVCIALIFNMSFLDDECIMRVYIMVWP